MISTLFNNGQRIILQVLDWAQSAWQSTIANRLTTYSQAGVCKAYLGEFTISPGSNSFSVTIGAGIAFDPLTNRIFISSSDITTYNASNPSQTTNDGTGNLVPTPQSTGCVNVPVTPNLLNYVWIDYLGTVNASIFTLQDVTLAKQFYQQSDGYVITVTTVNVPPTSNSVFLGTVNLVGGGVVSPTTISQTGRTYSANLPYRTLAQTPAVDKHDVTTSYGLGQTIFVDDHVKAIGTGTVSPTNAHGLSPADIGIAGASSLQFHQEFLHSAGIIGNTLNTTSSLYGEINNITPGFDQFIVFPLAVGEVILGSNGTTLTSANLPNQTILQFTNTDASGTWFIYVDLVNIVVSRTQTNLITNPNPNFYLLFSVTYTFPDPNNANGHLSNLADYRQFGDIAPRNAVDSLSAWIFEKINDCDKSFEFLTYFSSGPDTGSVETYDLYGTDANDHLEGLAGATTFTNGNALITGVGTDYLERFTDTAEGITDPTNSALGIVASVTDNTHLMLTSPWVGSTETVTASRIKYHIHVTYAYQNDPVFIGQRRLASSTQIFRFGAVTATTTTTYNYDNNDNLINTTTA